VESRVPGRCTEQPPTNHLRCDGTELNLTTQGMVLIEKMVVQLNLPVHLDRNLLLFLPFPYLHSQIALIFLPFTRHPLSGPSLFRGTVSGYVASWLAGIWDLRPQLQRATLPQG
jgi:hypothetical protein